MNAEVTSVCARRAQARTTNCAFADRVIVTLVTLRFQLPHAALAELYRVDRSTVTRAVREIRPLLAARGFAVPGRPGLRLRTLADVFAYAAAEGVELRHGRHRSPGPPAAGLFKRGNVELNIFPDGDTAAFRVSSSASDTASAQEPSGGRANNDLRYMNPARRST